MNFKDYPAVNSDASGNSVYADAITHCKNWKSYIEKGDNVTSVHECTHGINSDIRNANHALYSTMHTPRWGHRTTITPVNRLYTSRPIGKNINAFYCLKNRAVILTEPNCRKRDAASFIPKSLQFSRYSTYVTGQTAWDDMPYYLFDEGVAYANGADCVIDMASRGEYKETGNDFIFAPLEFLVYLAAVLMAAEQANSLDDDAKAFAQWHFYRVTNIYYAGKSILPWNDMEKVVAALKSGTDTTDMRKFLKEKIGFVFPDGPYVPPQPDKPLKPDDFNLG